MLWMERIEGSGGRLAPVVIDERGLRQPGKMALMSTYLPAHKGSMPSGEVDLDLAELVRCDGAEYLQALGFGHADPSSHDFFEFSHEGRKAVVPAVAIIASLVPHHVALAEVLLSANSLSAVSLPILNDGSLEAHGLASLPNPRAGTQERVNQFKLWLAAYESAQAFWTSVYVNALAGRVGLALPAVRIRCRLYRFRKSTSSELVGRMTVQAIVPTEPPLAFAAALAPTEFEFVDGRAKNLLKSRAARAAARRPIDPELRDMAACVELSDQDWGDLCQRSAESGFVVRQAARPMVQALLRQHALGLPWGDACEGQELPRSTPRAWRNSGFWGQVKAQFLALREHQHGR